MKIPEFYRELKETVLAGLPCLSFDNVLGVLDMQGRPTHQYNYEIYHVNGSTILVDITAHAPVGGLKGSRIVGRDLIQSAHTVEIIVSPPNEELENRIEVLVEKHAGETAHIEYQDGD